MVFRPNTFLSEYRPARKQSLFSSDGWWLNRWPLLGWLETFVKIGAWCFVPYIAVPNAPRVSIEMSSPAFLVQTFIMGAASVLIGAAVFDRLFYRDIISMVFVIPNNWAHWTVFAAMVRGGRGGVNVHYLRIFFWLMLAGDIIKLIFFVVHDFSIALVAKYVLYCLVVLFTLMYGVILAIDYGFFEDIIVLIYSLLMGILRKLIV